ncbi:hypothetical protein ncot_12645 [Nocardioides sp. JQ2195]|uniref:Gmad2 immunoglobulin-like domain-containing protein n=1 Tax=Nocardioides sp. JQ2195 TaxID=2592334 RepID=UPI00143E18D3|nr:Gmad2 immunoglobulin-like domain-containing protein [Nocardioides sp. JQ2195]QIX27356.1 hypothetical protein ncot_12645 [Nocardioides sp. JQ2195]
MTLSPHARHRRALVALAVSSLLVLTACGDEGSGDSAGDDPSRAESSAPIEESPSPATESSSAPEPSGTEAPAPGKDITVPVYYLGDDPRGTRLFREFHLLSGGDGLDMLTGALGEALSTQPEDPDYRNPWPDGTALGNATYDGDVITVDLSPGGTALRKRPASMTKADAAMSVEQLIYTAQAGAGEGRKPVQFLVDGSHTDTLLGVPAAEPLSNAKVLDTLSLMSITSPAEGKQVSGKFTATGANNGFEANLVWSVLDGDKVVKEGFGTADGWMGNRLFPWKVEVDVSGLAPGDYTFRVSNDDPSGGAEGSGPAVDTRTIVVK